MRRTALAALAIVCLTGPAVAQQPGEAMQRAVKLYDRGEFGAAAVAFHAILAQPGAYSPADVERAEWFVPKALFRLELWTAAQAFLDRIIANGPKHRYHSAVLKWYVGLARVLPPSDVGAKLALLEPGVDDPINAEVRDEYLRLLVSYRAGRSELDQAAALIARMPARSAETGLAHLAVAIAYLRRGNPELAGDSARAALATAIADGDRARAQLALGRATGDQAAFTAALADPSLHQAVAVGRALRRTDLARHDPDLVPLLYAAICEGADLDELLGSVTADFETILRYADSAERYQALRQTRDSPGSRLLASSMAAELSLLESLGAETKRAESIGAPWTGSAIATAVLQELTLREALAEADAGKLAGERIARLRLGLDQIRAHRAALATADGGCEAAATAKPDRPPPPPPPGRQPPPRSGCAGCAAGGGGGSAAALLLLGLASMRRRRSR